MQLEKPSVAGAHRPTVKRLLFTLRIRNHRKLLSGHNTNIYILKIKRSPLPCVKTKMEGEMENLGSNGWLESRQFLTGMRIETRTFALNSFFFGGVLGIRLRVLQWPGNHSIV